MARPLRIEYPGAWYHVMNRGAGRQPVFNDDAQRAYFLSLLGETQMRFQAEWHAYCLMGNHYHLLLRTPEANLQRIMRHVNGVYTQYFNRGENRDGPLFRGRYKAILVDAEAYWLRLSRYIHRNPLAAGLVRELVDYRWSSYRAYIGLEATLPWLRTEYVLGAIGQRRLQARYRTYVEGDADEALSALYQDSRFTPILGNDEFRKRALAGRAPTVDIPELARQRPRPTMEEVIAATSTRFGVPQRAVRVSKRGRGTSSPARSVAMHLCQEACAMTLSEIARVFGLASYASAGSAIRHLRQRMRADEALQAAVNRILLDLTP